MKSNGRKEEKGGGGDGSRTFKWQQEEGRKNWRTRRM